MICQGTPIIKTGDQIGFWESTIYAFWSLIVSQQPQAMYKLAECSKYKFWYIIIETRQEHLVFF